MLLSGSKSLRAAATELRAPNKTTSPSLPLRNVLDIYNAQGGLVKAVSESALQMQLANGSRIVTLPGKEANIRAYSSVSLRILDEAARVPTELYRSVRPMLAVSHGRLILL